LIETSDVHGAIFPFDFMKNKETSYSLAQVHTFIKQERKKSNDNVILLDNGDILQGQPVVYYYNFEKTGEQHLLSKVMNYMKYDAGTVGNHDIETGHAVYDKFHSELNFPWLAANALDEKTNKPYFKPYTILERSNIKVAVLGLITPYIPNWLPEKIWKGIIFEDMIASAKRWIKLIKEQEKPDVIVGLFHSGVDYTYGNQTADMEKNENASKLVAKLVPGFDVIFVGHDHEGWNFKEANILGDSVLIMGTMNAAKNIAVSEILLTKDPEKNSWNKEITGSLINVSKYKADEEFINMFSMYKDEVKNYFAKPIGVLTKRISTRQSMFGPSPFVDLIHTVQLDLTGADISFTAPLSFDATLDSGDIFVRDMFTLYKYENLLYSMNLSGMEIKNYLEFSLGGWLNQMKTEDDHLLLFVNDHKSNNRTDDRPILQNQFYNFCTAAGINYTVDITKSAGERVTIYSLADGSSFDLNKNYKVALNSYRGNGGGGHLTIGSKIPKEELPKRIINSTERDLRYYLMKWIEQNKVINPIQLNNWKIIPESLWQKGLEKDYPILYGKTEYKSH
jgi:2',3'-cyclic-nucleotide 2'-phosphodiesterase/3'-nucleotidase